MKPILLFGGTEEAKELGGLLVEAGADVVTSVADADAADYPGRVRRGGFGGVEPMAGFLREADVAVVVDASDPFAAVISPTAKRAARAAGVRYLRLERRPWRRSAGDRWTDVASLEEAADRIDEGARVMLAVGEQGLGPFLRRRDLSLAVRAAAPDLGPRHDVTVVRAEPSTVEAERGLFGRHPVDALVAKNTGDDHGAAMLVAARERRIHVYMLTRPRGQPRVNASTAPQMFRKLWRYRRP